MRARSYHDISIVQHLHYLLDVAGSQDQHEADQEQGRGGRTRTNLP
jgi:hypothetical protein